MSESGADIATTSTSDIRIRMGTVADIGVIAHHRATMFSEMGRTDDASFDLLVERMMVYFRRAIPAGEYVAWLAHTFDNADNVVAGAGALVRMIPPFPMGNVSNGFSVGDGRQALVQNVYTEKSWRRKGVAARIMREIIAWSEREKIESLILHASVDGRPLYEQLGFQSTNEMVYKNPRG